LVPLPVVSDPLFSLFSLTYSRGRKGEREREGGRGGEVEGIEKGGRGGGRG